MSETHAPTRTLVPALTSAHPYTRAASILAPPTRQQVLVWEPDIRAYGHWEPIPDRPPTHPVAVALIDEHHRFWTLGFDFDAKHGHTPEQATRDAQRFTIYLEACKVAGVDIRSGGGGRHVWVPLGFGVPAARVRRLANALTDLFPTLDPTPLLTPAIPKRTPLHNALRPPGTPHRNGVGCSGWFDAEGFGGDTADALEAARNYNRRKYPGEPDAWARLCLLAGVDDGYGKRVPAWVQNLLTARGESVDRSRNTWSVVSWAKQRGRTLSWLEGVIARTPGGVRDRVREERQQRDRDYLKLVWDRVEHGHDLEAAAATWLAWAKQKRPNEVGNLGELQDAAIGMSKIAADSGIVSDDGRSIVVNVSNRVAGIGINVGKDTTRKRFMRLCELGVMEHLPREDGRRSNRYALPVPKVCDELSHSLTGGGEPFGLYKPMATTVTNSATPIGKALSGVTNPTVARQSDTWRRVLAVLADAPEEGWRAADIAQRAGVSEDATRRLLARWAKDPKQPYARRIARGLYAPVFDLEQRLAETPHVDGSMMRVLRRRVSYTRDAYSYRHPARPRTVTNEDLPVIVVSNGLPSWNTTVGTMNLTKNATGNIETVSVTISNPSIPHASAHELVDDHEARWLLDLQQRC